MLVLTEAPFYTSGQPRLLCEASDEALQTPGLPLRGLRLERDPNKIDTYLYTYYVYTYTYLYIYMYTHICIYVCVYLHTTLTYDTLVKYVCIYMEIYRDVVLYTHVDITT